MNIVIISCFVIFFLAYLLPPDRSRNIRNYFLFLAYIYILFVHAFRDPFIFPDSSNYGEAFSLISGADSLGTIIKNPLILFRFEPGYVIFNYLVSRISVWEYAIFVAASIVIVSGYVYIVYRYSKAPIISLLIIIIYPLILQQSFFVLRQHMACAIFMFALPFVEKRKLGKFLLIAFLATSFHFSAIILIPIYWVFNFDFSRIKIKHFLLVFVFAIVFRTLFGYIASYNTRYEIFQEASGNTLVFSLFLFTSLLYTFAVYPKYREAQDKLIYVYNLYSLAICFFTVGLSLGRLTNYFSFFLCIIVADLYKRLLKPYNIYMVILFLLFTIYFNIITSSTFPKFSFR